MTGRGKKSNFRKIWYSPPFNLSREEKNALMYISSYMVQNVKQQLRPTSNPSSDAMIMYLLI